MYENPNWKESYLHFPPIPAVKKWLETSNTREQIITKKLLEEKTISLKEEKELNISDKVYT